MSEGPLVDRSYFCNRVPRKSHSSYVDRLHFYPPPSLFVQDAAGGGVGWNFAAPGYSVLRLLTGFARAALPARMLRISSAITSIAAPPIANSHQWRSV
jgi:hypothetical protein